MSLFFIALLGLGWLFVDRNAGLDQSYRFTAGFGVFSVFLAWTYSLWGWGEWVRRLTRVRAAFAGESMFFGLALAAFFAALLAHSAAIGPGREWIFWAFTAGGIILAPERKIRSRLADLRKPRWEQFSATDYFAFALLALLAALVALNTTFIRELQDVHAYHLYAPLHWWQNGATRFAPENPYNYTSGVWEYLHLWSFAFFTSARGTGLISVHLFGQFLHGMLALGLFCAAVCAFLARLGFNREWRFATLAAVVCLEPVFWTAFYAKNDFAAYAALFAAAVRIFPVAATENGENANVLGFHIGFALAIKLLAAVGLPFLVCFWFFLRPRPTGEGAASPLRVAGFALVFAAPIWLRNFFATGAPFFPLHLPGLSHPYTSKTVAEWWTRPTIAPFAGLEFSDLPARFAALGALEATLLPALPAAVWLALRGRVAERAYSRALLAALPISLAFFLNRVGDEQTARFLGFGFFLARIGCFLGIAALLDQVLRHRPRVSRFLSAFALVAVLSQPAVPWGAVRLAFSMPNPAALVGERFRGGKCMSFARRDLLEQTFFIMNLEALYLLPARRVAAAVHHVELDDIFRSEKDPERAFTAARALGYRYVVDVYYPPVDQPDYDNSYLFSRYLRAQRQAKIYEATDCVLVDLERIATHR